MSSLSIASIASMTLLDFSVSASCNISPKAAGMICQETPYLSLSQPHLCGSPPAPSFSHNLSTSSCRREGELRAPVQCDELLAFELECRGHHRSLWSGPSFSITHDADDFRILENGGVELHRLLG